MFNVNKEVSLNLEHPTRAFQRQTQFTILPGRHMGKAAAPDTLQDSPVRGGIAEVVGRTDQLPENRMLRAAADLEAKHTLRREDRRREVH